MSFRGRRSGPVNNTKFYKVLGIERDATDTEIKKAYKKLAIKLHPDKGGDEEKFKEVTHAFEILSDPQKREVYDQLGEEGLQDGGGGGMDPHDIFDAFFGGGIFGGGGGARRGQRQAKAPDVQHVLKVKLEDLYKGKTTKLAITRNRICSKCQGNGAVDSSKVSACSECRGTGIRTQLRQIAPGMVQQLQSHCATCSGTGEVIPPSARCTKCSGEKVVQERKVLEVYVEPGMEHGQKITFTGEAHEEPGALAGDVIMVLKQEEHEVFERKGANLIMEKSITLLEALNGFHFVVNHLDDRKVVITSTDVIKPDDLKSVPDEGMPYYRNTYEKGYLFIRFKIEFPVSLNPHQKGALENVLGPRPAVKIPIGDNVDEAKMIDFQKGHAEQQRRGGNAYDEDEDMDGGRRVECAHQ